MFRALRRSIGWLPLASAVFALCEPNARAAGPHYKRLCDSGDPSQPQCHAWHLVDDSGERIVSAAPNGLGATDLAAAYHLPKTGGNGRIIATQLGVHYPNAEADLNAYRMQYGLPPCTKANGCFIQVDGKGGTNFPQSGTCNGLLGESSLDIEMLSAGCPDCKIMLIEPSGAETGIDMAIGKGAVGISFSWGSGERSGDLQQESAWTRPGIGLFAATGDSGFMGPGVGSGVQSYPASSAGVVAVGGTTLKKSTSARGWDEAVWNGAGSGCSTIIPKPAWQTDTSCKMRMVADISAIADNVAVYCTDPGGGGGNGWSQAGGTSAASPFATGALAVTGVLNGSFNPAWLWQHAQDLYDITSGSNGSCTTAYYCKGGAGYDGPSGLGTPNGDALTGGTPPGDAGPGTGGSGGTGGGDSGARDGSAGSRPDAGLGGSMGGAGGAGMTTTAGTGGSVAGTGGSSSTGTGAGGASSTGGATSGTTTGASTTSSSSATGGSTTGGPPPAPQDSGCSCKLTKPTPDRSTAPAAMLLLALTALARFRSRSRLLRSRDAARSVDGLDGSRRFGLPRRDTA
jgi:hypothetical protein